MKIEETKEICQNLTNKHEIDEAKEICQNFANKHKIIFNDKGECGFGRECIGFCHGDRWIDFNPHDCYLDPIDGFQNENFNAPNGVNAYHKHDCLAVLGRGDDSIIGLARWVKHLESIGEIEVAIYNTGATGMQAFVNGTKGRAIKLK